MKCELVYRTGMDHVSIPTPWRMPREDQLKGTVAENLIELAGRGCYDSLGSPGSRSSADYLPNILLHEKHGSVAEHFHLTIEAGLDPLVFLGVPDVYVRRSGPARWRVTLNVRHLMEWPAQAVYDDPWHADYVEEAKNRWGRVFKEARASLCPQVWPAHDSAEVWDFCPPERPEETFVSLFLEDSRVWSHEMVRHRFNISQRSARYTDETDREFCVHPVMRDYLNEVGLDDPTSFSSMDRTKDDVLSVGTLLEGKEIDRRLMLGSMTSWFIAQSRNVYAAAVEQLQGFLEKKGVEKRTARKQARSAARYYLGNGTSTEMIFTASLRAWEGIFAQRVSPHADAAIYEMMTEAQKVVFP